MMRVYLSFTAAYKLIAQLPEKRQRFTIDFYVVIFSNQRDFYNDKNLGGS